MLILYYILPKKRIKSGTFLSTIEQLPIDKARRIRQIRDRRTQLQSIIGLKLVKLGFKQLKLRSFHLRKIHFSDKKPALRASNFSIGHFSISHSQNCICCVISESKKVGIDVERIRPLSLNLIEKYQLTQNSPSDKLSPISVWTQKEAIFKVFGEDKLHELKQIKIQHGVSVFKDHQYHVDTFILEDKYSMSIASLQPNTKVKIKRVYF